MIALGAFSKPPKGVATLLLTMSVNIALCCTVSQSTSLFPHRLKHLYSGRSGRGSGGGILSLRDSARLGSLRIA